jgi:TonB family protein
MRAFLWMKVLSLIVITFFLGQLSMGQINDTTSQNSTDTIGISVPQFPGGMKNFHAYFNDYFEDPGKRVEGTTYVAFRVLADGKLDSIRIYKSLGPEYDEALLELFKYIPNWIPGEENGSKTAHFYTIPIIFKLD